ncbi:class I SAM-dependent methyltransferase [Streptomyces zagrosensis]|uniref:SAM-dependent methyltransferase n=1 Tax=Streptomyces zagrosensis TaxID=1042984 RepID=A0A7W9Q5E1_9ACTN|nr:class I SAM-dependent methyltransferase [Streptomyces zagrosensis]MBB5933965.1 SAM-dependent methyltransferase [Streptomyces zagrosensis]
MTADEHELTIDEMVSVNRHNWDARTPVHVASEFYGLNGSHTSDHWFTAFEWEDLGDLTGQDVLHLQCHLGTETLAFAERGAAHTTGLDFSGAAIAQARRLAASAGQDVTYVEADVHDAVAALSRQRFDVVYTGKGALCYLPDLPRWARTVAALLRPGGFLYLVEFHPLLNSLGSVPQPDEQFLRLRQDYLGGRGPLRTDVPRTYTDGPPLAEATTCYEWRHGLGDIVTALLGAGLSIEVFRETDLLPWPRFEGMEPTDDGWWRLPARDPKIPLMFALRARRSVSTNQDGRPGRRRNW